MKTRFLRRAVLALLAVGASHVAQAQESLESFYGGRSVTLLVGYPPGGGYDVYARVLQRHMGRHLPGGASLVVRNAPGAASLTLANQLYAVEARDGSVFGTFARSIPMDRLMGRQGASYDPTRFGWIGSANNEVSICTINGALGVASLADFMSRPLTFGANAPGSESHMYPTILNNLLGARFKVVTGYLAANDLMLAIERGETDGRCGWTISAAKTAYADWLKQGRLFVAVQFATERHADMPDVPLALDLAKSAEQRDALELILTMQAMGRPFATPPETPAPRLQALRRAFDATMTDPAFLTEAEKQRLEVQPVSGERLQDLVGAMMKTPQPTIAAARRAIAF